MTTRRTAVAAALAGLAAVTVTGLAHAGAPAHAPAIRIPDRATITVNGHGYGHGHGLSQYGAEGAARKGLSGAQIVRFYYPHTKAGTSKGPVRVHITADTDDNTTVVARSGLKVRNLDNGSTAAVPTKGAAGQASRWRLSAGAGGATKVSYLNSGWHLWRTLRGDAELPGRRPAEARPAVVGGDLPRHPAAAPPARHPGQAAGHGQPRLPRRLRPRRHPARDARPVAPGRAPCPGDRGTHLRRLRGRRLHQPRLPALRHHQLPGLRRDVGRVLLDQRGHTGDGRARSAPTRAPRRSRSSPRAAAVGPATAASPTCPRRRTRTTGGRATASTPGRRRSPPAPSRRPGPRSAT